MNVVLIDDDAAFADALGLAISLTPHLDVVGYAHDSQQGYETVMSSRPDMVISDYRLGDTTTGVDCIRRLRRDGVHAPAAILTGYLAPQVEREVDAIARTYALSKRERITTLIKQFSSITNGTHRPGLRSDDRLLSEAEFEVLEAIKDGAGASEIASELVVSIHTVRSRIKTLMRKLGVSSQIEAVAEATRLGLLVPPG